VSSGESIPPDSVNLADLISFIVYRFFLIEEFNKIKIVIKYGQNANKAVLHSNITHERGLRSAIYRLALRKTWQYVITSSIPALTITFFTVYSKFVDKTSINPFGSGYLLS